MASTPGFHLLALTILAGFLLPAHAQVNITSSRCVDPPAYTSCSADVKSAGDTCMDGCNGSWSCIAQCRCSTHQHYLNCMASACWNQVYSCEYQQLVVQYFDICSSAHGPIPFWPAPANAPAACSCNLGRVWDYIRNVGDEQVSCFDKMFSSVSGTDAIETANRASERACCGASARYSAAHTLCPNTLPTLPDPAPWSASLNAVRDWTWHWTWSSCDSILASTNCHGDLGFTKPPGDAKFYSPDDLPDNGEETMSNGDGTVTAPPSGTVFAWHQAATTYTVTASAYQNEEVDSRSGTETGAAAVQTVKTGTGSRAGKATWGGVFVAPVLGVIFRYIKG